MPMLSSLSPALLLSLGFAVLLCLGLLTQLWLASRQIRHVARHRQQVPAPFGEQVSIEEHRKAADYTLAKARLALIELSWGAAVLLGWTLLGGLDLLNQVLYRALGPGLPQQLALLTGFALVGGLLDLPFAWYRTFRLEARFGFNRSTLRLWLLDGLKGLLLGALLGLPLAALLLWLMASTGPHWWLWAWGTWMAFNLLLMVLFPTVIAPLFNKFEPLQDAVQRTRIESLLQRCGFAAKGVFVMDGSKRSAHANAYFTGFGPAKRVVFFDTLLQQLTPAEIDAVLAHELGHFKHRHILQRMLALFGFSLFGFALLGWLSGQVWFYTGLGVTPLLDGPNDALALLLFALAVPQVTFFTTPLFSLLSRRHEFQADAFAAQHASGGDLANALLKLTRDNAATLTPDPLYVRFYYSHPPTTERLSHLAALNP
ncbi:MAG TPA: M48 family metallopeptidase [Macromonas sp.]|nr:M48 family metallopeptidase [Macromonas sp.]